MRSTTTSSRRHFLKAAAAGLILTTENPRAADPPAKLRAAVIGHTGRGDYGHGLEAIFSQRPNLEVVALADPDPAGRAKTAAKIGAPRQYADYREMLAKEQPQLVSLAMRHADLHFEIALAALKSGAHLYCEKPFTTTPAEADTLLAEAEKRGRKIAVAHTMRMMPIMRRLRQAWQEGRFGDLVELRAYGKQDPRAGGEDMMVLGSHLFDLMRMFAGDPLNCSARVLWKGKEITAGDGRLVKDNVGLVAGDRVFAQFAFPNGVQASFTSAGELRETFGQWGMELLGSRGMARINCDLSPNVFLRQPSAWTKEGKTDQWLPMEPGAGGDTSLRNANPVDDWLAAIAENRAPECSGKNGAWAVEMVMGVYWAALEKRQAKFPLAQRGHPLQAAAPPEAVSGRR